MIGSGPGLMKSLSWLKWPFPQHVLLRTLDEVGQPLRGHLRQLHPVGRHRDSVLLGGSLLRSRAKLLSHHLATKPSCSK